MNNLQQYLVPYLISQVAAIVLLLMAYKSTRVARVLFSITFIAASAVNLNLGLNNPDVYLTYADMALPFYRDFIRGWFSHYNHILVPLIAAGQFLIGAGMLLNGWWVRWASIGAIIFLLAITPLMTGSAFPFPLLVSWAAWLVLKRDEKNFIWRSPGIRQVASDRKRTALSPASFLSWITWLLAAVATAAGLFVQGTYRDNAFVQTAWRANDWVTLLVMLPALLLMLSAKKTVRIRLIWAGLMAYMIYNYAFYLFGAVFNVAFLVYVGIVASAVWAMVDLLRNLPVGKLLFLSKHNKWIAGYLFLIAVLLLVIEVPASVGFIFTGVLPAIVVKSNHPTSIVYALDLTMVFPSLVVAGYWLWKQKPWGYVLASMMLLKAAAYGLVLCSGAILLRLNNLEKDSLLPFYLFITVGGITGLAVLLRSLRIGEETKPGSVNIFGTNTYAETSIAKS